MMGQCFDHLSSLLTSKHQPVQSFKKLSVYLESGLLLGPTTSTSLLQTVGSKIVRIGSDGCRQLLSMSSLVFSYFSSCYEHDTMTVTLRQISTISRLKAETTEYLYHLLESAVWILYVGRYRYDIIHAHLNKMDLMEPSLISKLVGLAQTCLLSLLSLDCHLGNFLWSATRDVFNIRDWYFMCHRGDLIKCYTIYEN